MARWPKDIDETVDYIVEWSHGARAARLREHMNVQDLQLLEVLDFDPREGLITFRDQRMLIQGAGAMGLLRKELIETLGVATARRLLLRFGYGDG